MYENAQNCSRYQNLEVVSVVHREDYLLLKLHLVLLIVTRLLRDRRFLYSQRGQLRDPVHRPVRGF